MTLSPKKQAEKRIAKLLNVAAEEGYRNVVEMDGLICALHPFAVTWGIVVNIDELGYERRYCFEEYGDALVAFAKYTNPRDTHPTGPWLKCKGVFKGEPVDMHNPAMFASDPMRPGVMIRKEYEDDDEQELRQARQQVA
jgi:hypothetical protein